MNLVKRVHPASLGLSAAGLAGTASGVVGSLVKAARDLTRRETPTSDPSRVSRPSGPNIVLAEPHAPDEPPVDVVGMALAAEADAASGAVAHEPRAASREEEHGAALRRTTVEEIDDEAMEALIESDPDQY